MQVRYAVHLDHAKTLDTEGLRKEFLVEEIFQPEQISLTYSHVDRVIVGGIMPVMGTLRFGPELGRHTGTDFFLERRELGLINIGGDCEIRVEGETHLVRSEEALYIGMGVRELSFRSVDPAKPAKLYFNSTPAHTTYPTKRVTLEQASPETLGDPLTSNRRTIYKYIVPGVVQTCQLMLGMTRLEPGCLWNTMPCHRHERRMEVYFYFGMQPDGVVFHMMGKPDETRHIVVRNEQAVISPSWSIHTGVGTQAYTFIWGMAGENQVFKDMDHVPMTDLR